MEKLLTVKDFSSVFQSYDIGFNESDELKNYQ